MREGRPGFPPLLSSGDPPEQELSEECIIFFLAVFLCFPQHIALHQNLPPFLSLEPYLCAWDSSML